MSRSRLAGASALAGLALNGPDLLVPVDVNLQEGMQAVADAILATGVDELD